MLTEAKELQENAVRQLLKVLEENRTQKEFTFKAPTGSGKTYMIADFINKVLQNPNLFLKGKDFGTDGIIFLVSSLSKADLAKQNYEKFLQYCHFKNLKPYLINSDISSEERLFIPTDYNVYFLPKDLYKKGSRLKQGVLEGFLHNMTLSKQLKGEGKTVILIKDECHIKTSNLDTLQDYINTIINFSATPNLKRGQKPDVEITNEEAEQVKLIKHIDWGNYNESVETALKKLKEIQTQYLNLLDTNPCLIIQISNKDKGDDEINKLKPLLEKENLKYMIIVDDAKKCDSNDKLKTIPVDKWKDFAKERKSLIDVIVFKLGLTEGWDIPRACMLYQIRDTDSDQLDEQVIGRVRRNPCLLNFENLSDEAQNLAMTAWVWGIQPKNMNIYHSVKLQNETADISNSIKVKTTKLKEINNKTSFDLAEFLEKQKEETYNKSIFELGRALNNANNDIQKLVYDYADDYSKWWKATENLTEIKKQYSKQICDYKNSMTLAEEVSFSPTSYYAESTHYINIGHWVWQRKDKSEKFSFDSEAEKLWADILKELSSNMEKAKNKYINQGKDIYLWGKNYLPNSNIKFAYYTDSTHMSYPDFIMKDKFGRVHIFEVKSLNVASKAEINSQEYKDKIRALKEAYKHASYLTNQIFYLPQLKNDIWQIIQFIDGKEETITKTMFENFVAAKP